MYKFVTYFSPSLFKQRRFLIADCPMPQFMTNTDVTSIMKHMVYGLFALPMGVQIRHGEVTYAVNSRLTMARSSNVDRSSADALADYRDKTLADEQIRIVSCHFLINTDFHSHFFTFPWISVPLLLYFFAEIIDF